MTPIEIAHQFVREFRDSISYTLAVGIVDGEP